MKAKKCKHCLKPHTGINAWCSPNCGYALAITKVKAAKEKKERKEIKIRKEKLKSRRDWLKDAQVAFNAYIRARDSGLGCISCGTLTAGQYHAGHYRTVKAMPELRYNEFNVMLQCAQCNNFDSGNILEYRLGLIKRIGIDKVEWLETNQHESLKYTIDELKELIKLHRKKARDLNKSSN